MSDKELLEYVKQRFTDYGKSRFQNSLVYNKLSDQVFSYFQNNYGDEYTPVMGKMFVVLFIAKHDALREYVKTHLTQGKSEITIPMFGEAYAITHSNDIREDIRNRFFV